MKVLRDTGCTTVFISEYLNKKGKNTGNFQNVTLANGSCCKCREVIIPIETINISDQVRALVMDNPFADLVNSYRRDRIFNPQLTAIKNSYNKA